MSIPYIRLERNSRPSLAEQIASQWIDTIRTGRIQPGAKLPPVRETARLLQVSLETAQKAYQIMQQGGWVESRPRLGNIVLPRSLSSHAQKE